MITVSVRLFAGLHQLIGEREIEMQLPDGATIEQLRTTLGEQYPVVVALLPTLVCAIDEEYVEPSQVLHDGDHVALIPPVSGGAIVSRFAERATPGAQPGAPTVTIHARDSGQEGGA